DRQALRLGARRNERTAAGAASGSRLAALLLGPILHLAGGPAAAPSHPLAPLRDQQRFRGPRPPRRAPRPAPSGDARRRGEFRTGSRARPSRARAAASSSTAAEAGTAQRASEQTLQLLLAGAIIGALVAPES